MSAGTLTKSASGHGTYSIAAKLSKGMSAGRNRRYHRICLDRLPGYTYLLIGMHKHRRTGSTTAMPDTMLTSCKLNQACDESRCANDIRSSSVANPRIVKTCSGRVFALDIFKTGFEQDTMSKEGGRRYRNVVLRLGGSQPEMKTLTDYLGRQPSTRPEFEYLGIASSDDDDEERGD